MSKKTLIKILILIVIALTIYLYFRPIPLLEDVDDASILFLGFNPGESRTEEITDYDREKLIAFLNTCKKRRVLYYENIGHLSYPLDMIIIMNVGNPTIELGHSVNDVQSKGTHYKMANAEAVLKTIHEILGLAEGQEG